MSSPNTKNLKEIHFYTTAEYECGYLPQQSARSLVAAPAHLIDTKAYTKLIEQGFRRSGLFTYKPKCFSCNACIPIRIPVDRFTLSRSQKRVLKHCADLRTNILELDLYEDHLDLYQNYQRTRHADSEMAVDAKMQYKNFLLTSSVDSILIEYRNRRDELKMVSLVDMLENGLSAVYTFYDPNSKLSLGTYGVLSQIMMCRDMGLKWLYLGYWIKECQKMSYKSNFKPYQYFENNCWLDAAN